MSETHSHDQPDAVPKKREPALDVGETVNPVLARLIEEVRNEGTKDQGTYDRVHNRHNR